MIIIIFFLFLLGIFFIIIGINLLRQRNDLQQQIDAMNQTETYNVQYLQELAQEIANELGESGSLFQQTEVKGITHCDEPLTGNLSKESCVFCQTIITEQYQETHWEENDEGEMEQVTERKNAILNRNTQCVDFFVEDSTGQILVHPDKAKVEGKKVYDHFQPAGGIQEFEFYLGEIKVEFSPRCDETHRTLGYHFQEVIIPVETEVYVLGEVSDVHGRLQIQQPNEEDQFFLISHKSEEELSREKRELIKRKGVQSKISLGFGIGLIIFPLISLFIS